MDLINTFRNPAAAKKLSKEIYDIIGSDHFKIMEVCGGQTHTIYKYRLKDFLPEGLTLVSGPGCPVCVTPISYIDKAVFLALEKHATIFTFGDLLKVPGTKLSLEKAKALGADIRIIYSPLHAVTHAQENRDSEVVFLGIGFETTVPSIGLTIKNAANLKCNNFSVLLSAKRVPPLLEALLSSKDVALNGFITPGHVTAIIGTKAYEEICSEFKVPMVVGGFEPLDILLAIHKLSALLVDRKSSNENAYTRVTTYDGNKKGQEVIDEIFEPADDEIRGLGIIPEAGYRIRSDFDQFNAECRYTIQVESAEPKGCICGLILSGQKTPGDCPLFRKSCTPESPIGSCMVSNEGCCSAAYLYGE